MNNIKFFRVHQLLSQAALASRIGVSQQAIAKWENGESLPSAEKLPLLADTFGCSIDELYGRSPPAPAARDSA